MGKFLDSVKRHKAHVENSLPDGKQELVDDYLLKTNKASGLYRRCVDEAKKDGVSHYKTPFSKDWLLATQGRNHAAFEVIKNLSSEDLHKSLSKTQLSHLRGYASRFKQADGVCREKLDSPKQKIVDDYLSKSAKATQFFMAGQAEASEKGVSFKNTDTGKEFFVSSFSRNESARVLLGALQQEDLLAVFSVKEIESIKSRSEKYEAQKESQEKNAPTYIENELRSQMEDLCSDLFPEGPSSRRGCSLRFGTNGSLSINISGRYVGSWKNFETEEKGGSIALIKYAKDLCCDT